MWTRTPSKSQRIRPEAEHRRSLAFSLVEVVIAIGITSFAILTIIGLLGVAMNSNAESEQYIEAADLATRIVTQYKETLNHGSAPVDWHSPLPAVDSITSNAPNDFSQPAPISLDGQTVSDTDAAYALSYIVWSEAKADSPYKLVYCSLKLLWPATAVLGNPAESERFSSYIVSTSFLVDQP